MKILNFKLPFTTKKPSIKITVVKDKDYKDWLKKQDSIVKAQADAFGFGPNGKHTLIVNNKAGKISAIFAFIKDTVGIYDFAAVQDHLKNNLSKNSLEKTVFEVSTAKLKQTEIDNACIGWGLAAYQFDNYKAKKSKPPLLAWPAKADKKRIRAYTNSIYLLRELVNTPANHLGPAELENATKHLAKQYDAKVSVIKDAKLLEKNFPVIHTVGDAATSARRPRLIDLKWGKKSHPKVTLVGKGVCYDTGGLNLKPGQYMKHMKKDMGGAAHVLGVASLIMALKLPVQLRVLIPAVENAVGGAAFRPGDILSSRKGLFIENTNTDAEGRLVLADSLTYACEAKPDLVIDFATLTGSARAALGEDIPAMFATDEKTAKSLVDISAHNDDPLWRMPLHQDYKRHITNSNGDLVNSAGLPGDLIYSALFLQQFMDDKTEWIHLDCFAWETSGRPGRAKGGKDTGLRSIFEMLEKRYG